MAKTPSSRFQIGTAELNGKPEKFLSRAPHDAPSDNPADVANRLFMIRGLQIKSEDLDNPNHPHNVVYLDGACQGPYLDKSRKIFSLDHHAGCIRQITLATCEQALYFARKRTISPVNLDVVGNDPDLDTMLAAYAIIRADRIALDDVFYERLRHIVSLAGNIDAYGFGYEDFLNLSINQIRSIRESISRLTSYEEKLKSKGKWEKTNFLEYAHRTMKTIDHEMLYGKMEKTAVKFDGLDSIDLGENQELVVAISSSGGIYHVEEDIMKKNPKCVCILYHDGRLKFTIKLTGMTSDFDLKPIYDKLTAAELNAKKALKIKDSQILNCGWNGAKEIGGAPRYPNGGGTYLDINTIKRIIAEELSLQVNEAKRKAEENRAAVAAANAKNGNGNGKTANGNGHPKPPVVQPAP